jgi:hypothetical protein
MTYNFRDVIIFNKAHNTLNYAAGPSLSFPFRVFTTLFHINSLADGLQFPYVRILHRKDALLFKQEQLDIGHNFIIIYDFDSYIF